MKKDLNTETPTAIGSLTKEQFDYEIRKSYESIMNDNVYSADVVAEEMFKKFGLK